MTEQINPLYVCTLWYKPGKTMQGLIENGRGHRTALIVATASGMMQALPVYYSDESMGVSVFLIGAVIGFFGLYLFAWLLRNFAASKAKRAIRSISFREYVCVSNANSSAPSPLRPFSPK